MGTMVRKCSVCGEVMGAVTMDTFDGERVSHGYCSVECSNFESVQLMFWDEKLGCINMDAACRVGGNYYFRGKQIMNYLFRHGNHLYGANTDGERYDEGIILEAQNDGHLTRVLREEIQKHKIMAILS